MFTVTKITHTLVLTHFGSAFIDNTLIFLFDFYKSCAVVFATP